MPNIHIDDIRAYAKACHLEANKLARSIGASYIAVSDAVAPTTLDKLTEAYGYAKCGIPVPVSGDFCAESILGMVDPSANVALRFVHDADHVRYQAGMTYQEEFMLAWLLAVRMGRSYGVTVGALCAIDMVGSVEHYHRFGEHSNRDQLLDTHNRVLIGA